MHTFGDRLRIERERLGLSQESLGEIGGVKKLAQINYEKGKRHPDSEYLAAIAAAGVDVLYVLTGQRPGRQLQAGVTDSDGSGRYQTDGSNAQTSAHLTENANPVTLPVAAESQGAYRLNRREQALIENYRGSDDEGRRAVEVTASALAHKDGGQKKSQGRE